MPGLPQGKNLRLNRRINTRKLLQHRCPIHSRYCELKDVKRKLETLRRNDGAKE
jgi:hypothetical protein